MLELLKSIGVPATAAAVVASLIVTVPFLFKLDERYAKETDLKFYVDRLERKVDRLEQAAARREADFRVELANLAGSQQTMVEFILQGRIPKPHSVLSASTPNPVAPSPSPSPSPLSMVGPPEPATSAHAPAPVQDKARNWRELADGLSTQQQRLQAPTER